MNKTFRYLMLSATFIAIISGTVCYYAFSKSEPYIDFVYERDMPAVQEIIDENWYWLFPEPKETYHPGYVQYVFKHRAPQANPLQHNKLIIKLLRVDNKTAGFVVYYMQSKHIGMLLFLAVKQEYRGKQYGEKMARYAVDQLIKLGATQINLLTRTDNAAARHIYTKKLGFHEIMNDPHGFVYFAYEPK